MMRLNKYLSESGICSRREADKLIKAGQIYVNGEKADLGMQVDDTMDISIGKKRIINRKEKIVLAFYKPRGIVCTENPRERKNIIRYINYPIRITYAGRLDKESEGLMIMTNDGDLIHEIMKAGHQHEKEYRVTVNEEVTDEFIKNLSKGVHIQDDEKEIDTITRKAVVKKVGKYTFDIILTQGINRQIRRMCESQGYKVTKLKRTRVMNITLKDLAVGKYRKLTTQELDELYEKIEESKNGRACQSPYESR
ncbi:23S rRNA pseudouridine2604 synthase [Aequitasia blattaphilus]|uniref:Pseudouridine synthase n=1 Tax=Aequitasia blattaphilus TaxID=2949332 RepID=A0ABT1EE29_9FIRM|nr:pseudouridine synthase [Aequitasia blattaphilus]MCP1102727.1 pseudouridine synthase [Aequitasia blattaphilus]MCR8615367.1 pseudouridine synthase [Aequitasia blattaphilus]